MQGEDGPGCFPKSVLILKDATKLFCELVYVALDEAHQVLVGVVVSKFQV